MLCRNRNFPAENVGFHSATGANGKVVREEFQPPLEVRKRVKAQGTRARWRDLQKKKKKQLLTPFPFPKSQIQITGRWCCYGQGGKRCGLAQA